MASTNTDFRIAIGLFDHPKMVKLEKRLGTAAQIALLRLWEFTTINRADGVLSSMDAEDIAIAAKWGGDSTQFIGALIDLRWLDRSDDGTIVVHDWEANNPWAAGAVERSDKGKYAAMVKNHGKAAADIWRETGELPSQKSSRGSKNTPAPSQIDVSACPQHDGAEVVDASSSAKSCSEHNSEQDLALPLSFPFLSDSSPYPEDTPLTPQGAPAAPGDVGEEACEELEDEFDPKDYFADFYAAFPRKKGRDAAERKFCTKVRTFETFEAVMAGLQRARRSPEWTKDNGKFIPYPGTWLNAGGWKDEIEDDDGGTVYLPDGRMFVDGREVDVQAMLKAGRTPMAPKPDPDEKQYRKPSEIPGFRYIGSRGGKSIAEIGREHAARIGRSVPGPAPTVAAAGG